MICISCAGYAYNPTGNIMEPALDLEALDAALEAQSNLATGMQAEQRTAPENVRIPGEHFLIARWYAQCCRMSGSKVGASRRVCFPLMWTVLQHTGLLCRLLMHAGCRRYAVLLCNGQQDVCCISACGCPWEWKAGM